MTYLELLKTLHSNGGTTPASLLAALNDDSLLAALGVADSALVDALKHDITASNVRLALLVGDSQYRTEHFATEQTCRAHCEAENALIVERDYQGNKEKWLNDGHALEWLPVTVAEWLDYDPLGELPEPYRFEHGHLYEYSPAENAAVFRMTCRAWWRQHLYNHSF